MKERVFWSILNCLFILCFPVAALSFARMGRSQTPCRKCRWHNERYVMRLGLMDKCVHPDSTAQEYTLTGKSISLAATTRREACKGDWWESRKGVRNG